MEEFLGKKYKLKSSENFEEYMKFIDATPSLATGVVSGTKFGIGFVSRKAAMAVSPVACLTLNPDGSYSLSMCTPIRDVLLTFRPGQEMDETRADGVKVKTVLTIKGNKMIQVQFEDNGRKSTHLREFIGDKLIVTSTCEGWDGASVRTYVLVA